MKKDNFFRNSIILTLSNSTMGVLKFVFSVILSKKLGAEGMGLYSLIMPIYDLFCCLVCGGLVTAVSKESAVLFDKNDYINLHRSIKICFYFDLIWSTIIALIVFTASPFISTYIIKDSRALYSIRMICPAILFVALSSIIKGYFYGISKVSVPAIIDIVEKAIRITVVIGIINIFSLKEITKTITVVYFSLSLGEFISFLLLFIYYNHHKRKFTTSSFKLERRSQLLFNILIVSIPLCVNGFLSTALSTVSTLIIPRRLVSTGILYGDALAMIGKFTGMALNIVFFPIVVIASMSIVLVPDISQSLNKKDYYSLEHRIYQVLRISFLIGISTFIISLVIPDSLGILFYKRSDLGSYIKFAAFSAPFVYTSITTFNMLSGLGKQNVLLRNSLIVSIEELILLYIFTGIKSINIYGYIISLIINCITSLIINIHEINKQCRISIIPSQCIIDILSGFLVYFVLVILNNLIPSSIFIFKNVFIIIVGFILYFLLISILDSTQSNSKV